MPTSRASRRSPRSPSARRRSGSKRARAVTVVPDRLGEEIDRQHSLVEMLAGRLRETADALDVGRPVDPVRLRRALRIHRGFLMEYHLPVDLAVGAELGAVRDVKLARLLKACQAELKRAAKFQADASSLVARAQTPDSVDSHAMGLLIRAEADRIERHHSEEAEAWSSRLTTSIPGPRRRALLSEIRQRYREHVKDEASLVAWAAQNHPSSD